MTSEQRTESHSKDFDAGESRPREKLSNPQYEVLRLWVLGGADAIGHHSTQTIESLIAEGFIDENGPTDRAKAYVERQELAIGRVEQAIKACGGRTIPEE